ncbi:MAG TPA: outer membrane beta-barrel protein [Chitinophagaceae bacterium]|nr:outer membrane beta-barrel protein [Chitinophagaceae bacterium]
MKKYFHIFAAMLMMICSYGQAPHTTTYTYNRLPDMISVHAGAGLSKIYGKNQSSATFLLSWDLGCGLRMPIFLHGFINPSINFSQVGSKYSQGDLYKLDYIDVSLDGEYDFCEPDFYFETGPRARLNVSANLKSNGTTTNVKSGFKSFDAGWDAGVGFRITPQINIYTLEYIGLTNIFTGGGGTGKNLSLSAGIRINMN